MEEDEQLLEDFIAMREWLEKEPEAHGEIIMILPGGEFVCVPAKNEHLLEEVCED